MADVVDAPTRSRMMSTIRGSNTGPELRLRRALHTAGLRFRLHRKDLPGRPDIVLPRHRLVIFVHGCFWHRHEGCRNATNPATRPEFWKDKFRSNVNRDVRNETLLVEAGWRVGIVWECSIKKHAPEYLVAEIRGWLAGSSPRLEI